MKIFDRTKAHPDKVNFVDEANITIGYDLAQDCCERAGWFISEDIHKQIPESLDNDKSIHDKTGTYYDYRINPRFRMDFTMEGGEQGGSAIFELYNHGSPKLYLHIFNDQNGYYSHGLTVETEDRNGKKTDYSLQL